jgi:hypothetical protein
MTKLMISVNLHYRLLKNANWFTRYLFPIVPAHPEKPIFLIELARVLASKESLVNESANRMLDIA